MYIQTYRHKTRGLLVALHYKTLGNNNIIIKIRELHDESFVSCHIDLVPGLEMRTPLIIIIHVCTTEETFLYACCGC